MVLRCRLAASSTIWPSHSIKRGYLQHFGRVSIFLHTITSNRKRWGIGMRSWLLAKIYYRIQRNACNASYGKRNKQDWFVAFVPTNSSRKLGFQLSTSFIYENPFCAYSQSRLSNSNHIWNRSSVESVSVHLHFSCAKTSNGLWFVSWTKLD
jgi:hypothetical protein